ncbi:MAG: beta-xylosidase, partial [Verrucomicrobiota bacterium]
LDGLPAKITKAQVRHFRIDANHSDAFTVWQRMGSPLTLSPKQFAELEKAGQLAELEPPKKIRVENGRTTLHLNLPREAVSLLVVEWNAPQ